MNTSSIFIVIAIITILLIAIGVFIYLIVTNRIEFSLTLSQKDQEKEIAVNKTAFETQEAERKRIGEDLHDDIGPQLALIKMHLSMVKLKHPEIDATIFDPLSDQLKATMSHVRQVSHDLVPGVLYELGLPVALKNISKQLDQMPGLDSEIAIDDNLPVLNKKKELAIYRIVQESVNNAIKHANASIINIELLSKEGKVIARVTDNGKGISEGEKDLAGLGMKSMIERAKAFNGDLNLRSEKDIGTTISLFLPAL